MQNFQLIHKANAMTREYFKPPPLISDVGIVFAARMVIRFAGLAPDRLNLREVNKDLEALMEKFKTGKLSSSEANQ